MGFLSDALPAPDILDLHHMLSGRCCSACHPVDIDCDNMIYDRRYILMDKASKHV